MKKLLKLAFAAALTLTAILATPRPAAADHCSLCAQTGDCVQCCKCEGGSSPYCLFYCNG